MRKILCLTVALLMATMPAFADMSMSGRSGLSKKGLTTALSTPYAQTLVVSPDSTKSNYTTITAALAAITDAATGKRYCIKVMPGTYTESFTCTSYVDIVGVNKHDVIITQTDTTVITAASNVTLQNLTLSITAPSAATKFAITYTAATLTSFYVINCDISMTWNAQDTYAVNFTSTTMTDVVFRDCEIYGDGTGNGYAIHWGASTSSTTRVYIERCRIYGTKYGIFWNTAGGTLNINYCDVTAGTNTLYQISSGVGVINSTGGVYTGSNFLIRASAGNTATYNSYGDTLPGITNFGGGGTETFNSYGSVVGTVLRHDGDVYTTVWTDYSATSTIVGWSSFTSKFIEYKVIGDLVYVNFKLQGTSDSTAVTFTLPSAVTHAEGTDLIIFSNNNGTEAVGRLSLANGSATVNCYSSAAGAAWTASGTKSVRGQFWYEK